MLATIAVVGTAAAVAVLLDERLPNPFSDTYDVSVELSAANGVVPGYGQPVNVAGVPVGTISGARAQGGQALITMAIRRSRLPHVYRDATAALEPVTPLKDMELELNPGHPPPARSGRAGANYDPGGRQHLAGRARGPARRARRRHADLLASLISSLGTGTAGQGQNMRRLLVALGPTAHQTREIATALAARRAQIAQLVHNLAMVTRAASQDGRLAQVVQAGDATLRAAPPRTPRCGSRSRSCRARCVGPPALTDASDIARAAGRR